jgi:hypothetical protein
MAQGDRRIHLIQVIRRIQEKYKRCIRQPNAYCATDSKSTIGSLLLGTVSNNVSPVPRQTFAVLRYCETMEYPILKIRYLQFLDIAKLYSSIKRIAVIRYCQTVPYYRNMPIFWGGSIGKPEYFTPIFV